MDVENTADKQESKAPRGFCPHCDYPIDPGLCPECGETIAPETLRHVSRQHRSRRILRIALRSIVITVLLAGAYWGYRSEVWARLVPIRVVTHNSATDGWALRELHRRVYSNTADNETINAIVDELLKTKLHMKSPRPIEIPLDVDLLVNHIPVGAEIRVNNSELKLDGATLKEDWIKSDKSWYQSASSPAIVRTDPIYKQIGPGSRRLDLIMDVTVTITNQQNRWGAYQPVQRRIMVSKDFEVADQDVWQFLDSRTVPPNAIEAIKKSLKLGLCAQVVSTGWGSKKQHFSLLIINDSLPYKLVGQIDIFKRQTEPASKYTIDYDLIANRSGWSSTFYPIQWQTAFDHLDGKFDVRFMSDPARTFEDNEVELPPLAIWWRGISVEHLADEPNATDFNLKTMQEPWMYAPTTVRELTGPTEN